MTTPRILIIAGSDSGGGAGIQADIKTVTMLGGHAMTAVTAITAQNTLGVDAVHSVPAEMILAQINSVVDDIGVDAIKIGMIGGGFAARMVAERLGELYPRVPIVFDPVMVATSGDALADDATVAAFGELMKIATIATPNLPELRRLSSEEDPVAAALSLVSEHGCAVLIKGGHDEGEALADALIETDNITSWQGTRIDTTSTHGTGCTLASAIAFYLGAGCQPAQAVERARSFVRIAMLDAPGLGKGHGPLGHQNVRLDTGLGLRLNQVTVTGKDFAKMVGFYRALGLKQIVDSPENLYARFEAGGATFSIQCDPEAEVGETVAVYFECDDLDDRVERLARLGIPFEHGPRNQPWMWREARLRDPGGNTVFLYKAGEARRFPPWRLEN
ncbi:bifunctional hydroxymethylpyrimidine kinase/phosphomethylpyrimidine kinase [Sphingomonas sp. HDW15A]|uniref:bifunctional hydroxymethylpyrimidine kinase/phosphomethylpyrimidine kinase n=1 Tax=Sphingomonas sp. HDW15A TaxID=2714942 RepID=UPI00140AB220|nr:bifunctional hydroxymethylpyrimidine kinase/phosphomethylpyrimidine kinase [Sphingomonas sp. HDW15A]QIK95698.1 bifunctional hydroxymethylpyrimidine kinase/phosphomethylpyrimidine kinase [Sphingomonas sp. HDW15A]